EMKAGELDASIGDYRVAAGMLDELSRADAVNARVRRLAGSARLTLGFGLESAGQTRPAMEAYRQSARETEALMHSDPANSQAKIDYAVALRYAADLQYKLGDKPGSLEDYRRALAALAPLAEA